MAGARSAGRHAVRRRARRGDRQRRAPVHRHRARLLPTGPPVGGQRLRAHLRRLPAARRARRRPARPAAHVHARADRVRVRLAGGRSRADRHPAHRGPRSAGTRRGDPRPGRALDRGRDLRRGRRAQQGDGRLGCRGRQRRRRRSAPRRSAHRVARLGVGLLGERADRAGRGVPRAAPDRGEPRHESRAPLRRHRCRDRHGRPVDPRLRARGRRERGMGVHPDDRTARARRSPCSAPSS